MTVTEAIEILKEWTTSESLLLHAAVVAAAMEAYGKFHHEAIDEYKIVGLLHDMDYEKHPTTEEHPYIGANFLKQKGLPEHMVNAILGHATYTQVSRNTNLARSLFAVDELAGFITAVAYMTYPGKPKVKSVKKKLKDKRFAAKVNRQEIEDGILELDVDRDEHIERVIEAVWGIFQKYKAGQSLFDSF